MSTENSKPALHDDILRDYAADVAVEVEEMVKAGGTAERLCGCLFRFAQAIQGIDPSKKAGYL